MSAWSDFYTPRMNTRYRAYCGNRYRDFIETVGEAAKWGVAAPGPTLIEAGCGAGFITRHVSYALERIDRRGLIVAFDNDKDVLALAEENTAGRPNVRLAFGDMTKTELRHGEKRFDVIYSHGVLEHFTDETIRSIIERQKAAARTIVHYVPLEGHGKPSFGDERLMSTSAWEDLVCPTGLLPFNAGKDLVLIWEARKAVRPAVPATQNR